MDKKIAFIGSGNMGKAIIGGIVNFLVLYFFGEMIHMGLAVEENTRLTAALLLRMHQESRVSDEQAAYVESGFVADSYE